MTINVFKYCPRCAQATLEKNDQQFSCSNPACGQVFFQNVAAATAALIEHEDHLLLIRRAKSPGKGKLGFPGGFVDPGESLELALSREISEEVGLLSQQMRYVYSACNPYEYAGVLYFTSDAFFEVDVLNHELEIDPNEVQSADWIAVDNIQASDFAFATHSAAFEFWLNRRKQKSEDQA